MDIIKRRIAFFLTGDMDNIYKLGEMNKQPQYFSEDYLHYIDDDEVFSISVGFMAKGGADKKLDCIAPDTA